MVLRARFRRGNHAPLSRQALLGPLQQQALPRAVDAVHALLSVVPHEGAPGVEIAGQSAQLQGLRLGHRARILELLRLVQGARQARLTARPGRLVSNLVDGLLVLDGAFKPDSQAADVGGGSVVAFTARAPDKDTENEDTLAVIPWGPESVVLVVADGAGGLPAGKRASMTAVSSLVEALSVAMSATVVLRTAILDGIEAANDAVMRLSNGSATTMTVVTVEGKVARSYQIGDSEALVVGQRGRIKLQTTAHSPTGFAVEAGFLDEREALHHAERHLVSNFLGTSDMKIDIGAPVELRPRDTVLLASDGLTDNVHLHEIIEHIRKGPADAAVDAVVDLARRRMQSHNSKEPSKPDDLSLIVYRKWPPPRRKSRSRT
jgi:serine/threonine protein phosphatase PrpC